MHKPSITYVSPESRVELVVDLTPNLGVLLSIPLVPVSDPHAHSEVRDSNPSTHAFYMSGVHSFVYRFFRFTVIVAPT